MVIGLANICSLSSRTPTFFKKYIEGQDNPIVFADVSPVLFLDFLKYVYSQEIPEDTTIRDSLDSYLVANEGSHIKTGYHNLSHDLSSLQDKSEYKDVSFV